MKLLSFFTQKDLPASQKTAILHEKMTKMVPKTRPNPAKSDVLHEKKFRFLLKKTIQPRKKVKFCMKKLGRKKKYGNIETFGYRIRNLANRRNNAYSEMQDLQPQVVYTVCYYIL